MEYGWMDGKIDRQTGRYKDEWIEGETGGWTVE
jgi:hypothetical protein